MLPPGRLTTCPSGQRAVHTRHNVCLESGLGGAQLQGWRHVGRRGLFDVKVGRYIKGRLWATDVSDD